MCEAGGHYYPRRALRAAETPDGRLQKRLTCRFLRSGGRSSPHDSYFLANTQNFLLAVPVANAFALWYDKFSKLEVVIPPSHRLDKDSIRPITLEILQTL